MSLGKILKWAGRRLKEPSTYTGVAIVAGALGADKLGVQIGQVGQAAGLIFGTGLMAATTAVHPPINDLMGLR